LCNEHGAPPTGSGGSASAGAADKTALNVIAENNTANRSAIGR
jgi:hypothetical protein